jgi:hypothetical protein
MTLTKPDVMTVGAVARYFGCRTWMVRRLFERGLLPPAPRMGPMRVVSECDLPVVERALLNAGYLAGEVANVA